MDEEEKKGDHATESKSKKDSEEKVETVFRQRSKESKTLC